VGDRDVGAASGRSITALLGEALDLGAGFTVVALPFVATALPGIFLFLVLPVIALAVVAAIPALAGALLLGPPYLAFRALSRRLSKA
jgi:hypothetical protein